MGKKTSDIFVHGLYIIITPPKSVLSANLYFASDVGREVDIGLCLLINFDASDSCSRVRLRNCG